MRLSCLLAAAALTAPQQALVAQAPNQVSMCVTTAIGTCGTFCEPFDCQPHYTLVSSHEDIVFDVAGAPDSPYVLFVGVAVPGCLTIPGVAGQMATWTPAATVAINMLPATGYQPNLPCQPWTSSYTVHVPAVPPGVDIRFQVLGVNTVNNSPELTFSRPTEVRTR
ncbi:MAG: hypothetical protein NXI31_06730 [bacterium]|nr:hypothetical protein [bacterium]